MEILQSYTNPWILSVQFKPWDRHTISVCLVLLSWQYCSSWIQVSQLEWINLERIWVKSTSTKPRQNWSMNYTQNTWDISVCGKSMFGGISHTGDTVQHPYKTVIFLQNTLNRDSQVSYEGAFVVIATYTLITVMQHAIYCSNKLCCEHISLYKIYLPTK